jgi:hypothetical protein
MKPENLEMQVFQIISEDLLDLEELDRLRGAVEGNDSTRLESLHMAWCRAGSPSTGL